jgi:cell division protein FtsB
MSDFQYLSQEVANLKQLVYALSDHRPDTSDQAAKLVAKSEAALKTENDQLRAMINNLNAQIKRLDADDKKIVKDTQASLKVIAEAAGSAINDRCKQEERDIKSHISSTLGSVHSDVQAAKNASSMTIKMAEDFLVGQASHLCAKI